MQQTTGETITGQTVMMLLCVVLQVDCCVNFSQQSVAVSLQVPNVVGDHANEFKFLTCSACFRIWSVILVCLLSNADRFFNSTIVLLSLMTQSMMGDAAHPLSWKIGGVCIDGYPGLTSKATSRGEKRKCEARWHMNPETLLHVAAILTLQGWLD